MSDVLLDRAAAALREISKRLVTGDEGCGSALRSLPDGVTRRLVENTLNLLMHTRPPDRTLEACRTLAEAVSHMDGDEDDDDAIGRRANRYMDGTVDDFEREWVAVYEYL
jgi:hypothetical protein